MRTLLLAVLLALLFTGCKTRESSLSETEKITHRDTLHLVQFRHDSVVVRDSVRLMERMVGDTLHIEKHHWHISERVRVVRDTVYRTVRDTVHVATQSSTRVVGSSPSVPWLRLLLLAAAVALNAYLILKIFRHGKN